MTGRGLRPAILALALLAGPGCQEDVDYGYFAVRVSVDQTATDAWLARVAHCGVNVDGADVDFGFLTCAEGTLSGPEVGVFEWSTSTTGGTVQFTVTFKNAIGDTLGTGRSAEASISPGNTVETRVVVVPIPATLIPAR